MPVLTGAAIVAKNLLTPSKALHGVSSAGKGKLGAAAPPPPAPAAAPAAATTPAAATPHSAAAAGATAPAAATTAAAPVAAAAVATPAAATAGAPAATAAATAPVAAPAAAATGTAPAVAGTAVAGGTSSSSGGMSIIPFVVGGGVIAGGGVAAMMLMKPQKLTEEQKKPLQELLARQADHEAVLFRRLFTADDDVRRQARALLSADGEQDNNGNWTWSDEQEQELRKLMECAAGTAVLPDLAPALDQVWDLYAKGDDELSDARAEHFIEDYFEAFCDLIVPNILFAWIFLKEGPACPQEVLAMDFETMLQKYPLYGLTLENFMDKDKLDKIRTDWAAQDKSADLVKLVTDCIQANPQQFIPQSDTAIEYTIRRRSKDEKIGLNAVGCDQGCFIVEIVPGSCAEDAQPSGGGAAGLKAGMRVHEVSGMKISSTADIGIAVVDHSASGNPEPRMVIKVKVTESCARIHRINKVKIALRSDKDEITKRWLTFLRDPKSGKVTKKRLRECYNVDVERPEEKKVVDDEGNEEEPEVGPVCKGWIGITHGPIVKYAKEYIPKLGDTPINDCAVQ